MYNNVQLADISVDCRDIAEAVGMEAFLSLVRLCGGQNLYIPKEESLFRAARDRQIQDCFSGNNYRAIAKQYHLSERRVRTIVDVPRQ